MWLIKCKVESKLKWRKHCDLFENSNGNTDANFNNFIFTIKDTKLNVPAITLLAKDNQKLTKLLSKGFERSLYSNEYKMKS